MILYIGKNVFGYINRQGDMMEKQKRFTKSEWSWIMYDWANSAFSILAASVLSIYATEIARAEGIADSASDAIWLWAGALSALVVAIFAPILGAAADYKGKRMRMFAGFFAVAILSTGLISVTNTFVMLVLLYAITNLCFAGANVFYDAFLVDVTSRDRMDRVSSWGYAMGYIGGSTIPFIASIALLVLSEYWLGVIPISALLAMRLACGITAIWWAVFTIPFFKHVRQVSYIEPERNIIRKSFARIVKSAKLMIEEKNLFKFFIAYFCYINGVGAIIMSASKLATSLDFDILYILGGLFITQIVACPCSIAYNHLSRKFSNKTMIMVGICTYVLVSIVGLFMTESWHFLVLAGLVGTAQGGIQALSRSFFGKLIPDKKRAGEFFGFYNIFGRFESVLGTALMAIVRMFTDDVHYAIIPVLVLFIAGGALMLTVPNDKDVPEAEETEVSA